jgi:predicted phosphodiesterase
MIFSDIHADIAAIKTIFECAASPEFEERFGKVKKVINLGDVMGRGYFPAKVIEFIKNLDMEVVSILGNHDESIIYDWNVSGDDYIAARIHEEFKEKREHWDYFEGLEDKHIDTEKNLLCIHGGPIDPDSISPEGLSAYNRWLYQRTWQRLERENSYFNPYTGFRYTPKMAFEHAKRTLTSQVKEGEYVLIFCGHQHREAVYQEKEEEIKNIHGLIKTKQASIGCGANTLHFSDFSLEKKSSYLIRFGIAGPIGYEFTKAQFGVLNMDEGEPKIALLEVDYSELAKEEMKGIQGMNDI